MVLSLGFVLQFSMVSHIIVIKSDSLGVEPIVSTSTTYLQ